MLGGIEFHIDGAAKLNALWPMVVLMWGTCRRWSALERSVCGGIWWWTVRDKYDGEPDWRIRYRLFIHLILNCTRSTEKNTHTSVQKSNTSHR